MTFTFMLLVAVLAALLLTRPWWSRAGRDPVRRRAANASAFRSRVQEIEADVAAGVLARATADELRREMEAQLVVDAAPVEPAGSESPGLSARAGIAIAVALLVFGASFYYLQGSWRDQAIIDLSRRDPGTAQEMAIKAMVANLEERLRAQPDDAEGWAMLGRSRVVLHDYVGSASAYERANTLTAQRNADWLVGEGEALAIARERNLEGRPRQLFEAALQLQADHARALWYAGLAAAQVEDYPAARAHWLKLRGLPDLPQDLAQVIDERLQAIAQATGEPTPAPTPLAAATPVSLKVKVRLAEALAARRKPGAVLFVFAKAAGGPPMPLAVQRIADPQFPLEVTLDDSMAMMPQLKLSQFQDWVLSARLSSSGDVQGAPGDPEGSLPVSRAQATAPVELLIDRSRP